MQDAKTQIYIFGFIFLFLIVAASSLHSYSLFSDSRDNYNRQTRINDQQLDSVLKMRVAVRERAIILWHMSLEEDIFDRDDLFEKFYHYGSEYKKARDQFLKLPNTSEETVLFQALDKETNQRAPVLRAFAEKLLLENHEDYTQDLNQTLTDQIVVADLLDQLISLQQHQNNIARSQSSAEIETILADQIQVLILLFGFGVAFAGYVLMTSAKQRTQLAQANKQLEIQACHDSLTGLPNRSFLLKQLELMLASARRHHRTCAVMFIDLDDFKPINDQYGHKTGDLFLQLISQKMKEVVRETDVLSRLGGDEFILILSDVESEQSCEAVADKLLRVLSSEYLVEAKTLKTSASIGIYEITDPETTAEAAIILADQAMYQAKSLGKNQYYVI